MRCSVDKKFCLESVKEFLSSYYINIVRDEKWENEIFVDPFNISIWEKYISSKKTTNTLHVTFLYQRALIYNPKSFKLWYNYLNYLVTYLDHEQTFELLISAFERAVVFLNRFPKIWVMYIQFLSSLCTKMINNPNQANEFNYSKQCPFISWTRHVFDRCLQTIPVTMHLSVWKEFIKWLNLVCVPLNLSSTFQYAYYRYYKLAFLALTNEEQSFLIEDIKASNFHELLFFHLFRYKHIPSNFLSYLSFLNEIDNSNLMNCLPRFNIKLFVDIESILLNAIKHFHNNVHIWISLVLHHTNLKKDLEIIRADYAEALFESLKHIDAFIICFESYCNFEETMFSLRYKNINSLFSQYEIFSFNRFKWLVDNHSKILAGIKIRDNINSPTFWLERIFLENEISETALSIFENAIGNMQSHRVTEPIMHIFWRTWINSLIKQNFSNDINSPLFLCRLIMDKAVCYQYQTLDELVEIWMQYIDFEKNIAFFSHNFSYFWELIARVCSTRNKASSSSKLWSLILDIEEEIGIRERIEAAYEKAIQAKVITPQHMINYALFLESEKNSVESAFRVYERAISLFGWPSAFDIWNIYIPKYINWSLNEKCSLKERTVHLERIRELYEQACSKCPSNFIRPLYLGFADFEFNYRLSPRNSLNIIKKACDLAIDKDKLFLYQIYLQKTNDYMGINHARSTFELTLSSGKLDDDEIRFLSTSFATIEEMLGEFERVRSIYAYAAQLSDPKLYPNIWDTWAVFEKKHGTESTYRDMLRVRKAVENRYIFNFSQNYLMSNHTQIQKEPTPENTEEINLEC